MREVRKPDGRSGCTAVSTNAPVYTAVVRYAYRIIAHCGALKKKKKKKHGKVPSLNEPLVSGSRTRVAVSVCQLGLTAVTF